MPSGESQTHSYLPNAHSMASETPTDTEHPNTISIQFNYAECNDSLCLLRHLNSNSTRKEYKEINHNVSSRFFEVNM